MPKALSALLLACFLWLPAVPARAAIVPAQWAARERLNSSQEYVDAGEQLLHGANLIRNRPPSFHMPFVSILFAVLCNHSPAWITRWSVELPWILTSLLTFSLSLYLWNSPGRALAGVIAMFAIGEINVLFDDDPEIWYAVLIALAACVAAWRARRPSAARTAVLGTTVGMSLLYRSPLFLWLPFVAIDDRWTAWKEGRKAPPIWPAFALAGAGRFPKRS